MKRLVGVAQGNSIRILIELARRLEASGDARLTGAFVSDSGAFRNLAKDLPELGSPNLELEKEWEVTGRALEGANATAEDAALLAKYEGEVGEPAWYAMMADRRVFFGRYSKRKQDYRPKLSEGEMRAVLAETLRTIDRFFERARPDLVIAFGTATLSDYLVGLLAPARGIDYLQLKATKIGNYVSLNDKMVDLSGHVAERYLSGQVSEDARRVARAYLEEVGAKGVRYEGAIRLDLRLRDFQSHRQAVKLAKAAVLELRRQRDPVVRNDNHLDGFLKPAIIEGVLQPWRARQLRRRLGDRFLGQEELQRLGRFAFFPLHFEPEVSIQVFGRPYQNQIELIRNLALAMPAGVPLVVKEHPRSIGFRPFGYYEKLLEIPNVRLAEPLLPSIAIVREAALVAVISGTIGLEAAILGKPVLLFGRPAYAALPDSVVAKAQDPWGLPEQVRALLERTAAPDPEPIERLIAATVEGAVPVDLYTVLLGKAGRFRASDPGAAAADDREQNLQALAAYARARLSSL